MTIPQDRTPEDDELEISVQDRFDAPIYWLILERQFDSVDELNRGLADLIRDREASGQAQTRSARQYRAGFSTGPGFLELDHPSVHLLRYLVEDSVNDYVSQARQAGLPVYGQPATPVGWGFVLRQNDWVCPHSHGAGALAGVYNVQVPELEFPKGCLEFIKPRGMSFSLGIDPAPSSGREPPETKRLMPEAGRLLLFPSDYVHLVYPFSGEGERIAVGLTVTFTS